MKYMLMLVLISVTSFGSEEKKEEFYKKFETFIKCRDISFNAPVRMTKLINENQKVDTMKLIRILNQEAQECHRLTVEIEDIAKELNSNALLLKALESTSSRLSMDRNVYILLDNPKKAMNNKDDTIGYLRYKFVEEAAKDARKIEVKKWDELNKEYDRSKILTPEKKESLWFSWKIVFLFLVAYIASMIFKEREKNKKEKKAK